MSTFWSGTHLFVEMTFDLLGQIWPLRAKWKLQELIVGWSLTYEIKLHILGQFSKTQFSAPMVELSTLFYSSIELIFILFYDIIIWSCKFKCKFFFTIISFPSCYYKCSFWYVVADPLFIIDEKYIIITWIYIRTYIYLSICYTIHLMKYTSMRNIQQFITCFVNERM